MSTDKTDRNAKAEALRKMESTRARVRSVADQAWQDARSIKTHIYRIAEQGPDGSERDTLICRKIAYLAYGELLFRTAESDYPEPDKAEGGAE